MATAVTSVEVGDLATLLPDWLRSLRAENKAKNTLEAYEAGATQLLAFLRESGMPTEVAKITREHLDTFMEHLLATRKPATANNRYRALQRLFAYLVDEGELTDSPMVKMKPPKVTMTETAHLSDDELRALFRVCEGTKFEDRRDMAMFRLLGDTGCRSNELTSLKVEDVDRDAQVIFVMGKGSRPRAVPYGNRAAQAIDRYMRLRARHRFADTPWMWIGLRGKITNEGLRLLLANRSKRAQGSGACILTSSGTPSPTSGWPQERTRGTSCDWRAGSPARC